MLKKQQMMLQKEQVFVICAKEDVARAYPLLMELQKKGVILYLDVDGARSAMMREYRDAQMLNSGCVLVYYSQAMMQSDSCRSAMELAMSKCRESVLIAYPDVPLMMHRREVTRQQCADDAEFARVITQELTQLGVVQQGAAENDDTERRRAREDEIFEEYLHCAIDLAVEYGQISVPMMRRRLGIGYSLARRIVDQMAEMGIVSADGGPRPRQTLITREEYKK